jgi:hypothetical protein
MLTSATSGTGNAVVTFEVRENFTGTPRQGSLTIAGQTYTVIQDAGLPDCDYQITPTNRSFQTSGGSGSLSVFTAQHCAWRAMSNVNWITITSGSPGLGSGVVNFTVAPNPTSTVRKGRITVGTQVFNVKQKGS